MNKYGRELIGEEQGQFHNDFESKTGDVLYAEESIFVAKKVYCDKLCIEMADKTTIYEYHCREKGVPEPALWDVIDRDYEKDPLQMYKALYGGDAITYDLLVSKPSFDFKQFRYTSLNTFYRTLQFK